VLAAHSSAKESEPQRCPEVSQLIDPRAGLSSSGQPRRLEARFWVGSQRIYTFALTAHSAWESILRTGCATAYELCSAWFLIALSMPKKMRA
jgi:hypothetical protein